MQLPDENELRHDARYRSARIHWAINAGFSWINVIGLAATLAWAAFALFGSGGWLPVAGLFAGSMFAGYVAREYRRAAAKVIGDQLGLEGIPLEMEKWGDVRVAAAAKGRADAWHAERYGGKSEAELAELAREDEQMRRELEEFDKERQEGRG